MNYISLLETASFKPVSLAQPNAWVGHLPFAAWLIKTIQPGIFVELGTHTGNSYFSFCQAVEEAKLATKCYAVDTWQGEEHAGYYDEGVYQQVNTHNQQNYAHFSSLLRMTFDEAASLFENKSVQLLHIDGLHTYEAVRHDFETWLPKLAPGAIVLFHDTMVRERDFGVWKFWDELKSKYQNNIEFTHSNGLGVLQLNGVSKEDKMEWLQPEFQEKQRFLEYFNSLGLRQIDHLEFRETQTQLGILNQANAKLNAQLAEMDVQLAEMDVQLAERDAQLAERDAKIINLLLSRSWRLTKPFRLLGHGSSQLKLMALKSLRKVYRLIPLTPSQRAVLRSWYYRSTAIKSVLTASKPTHPAAGGQAVAPFTRAAMASAPFRILLIERSVPKPNQDAGSMMIYSYIRVFREQGYAVTFFPADLMYDPDYTPALQALGVTCLHVPLITSLHEHLKQAGSSYNYILSCRPDFTTAILQLLRTHCPQARILYETHDLHYVRQERQAELEQNADVRNELLKHARWRKDQELGIVKAVDCTIVVSEQERTTLLRELPEMHVEVIPVVSEARSSTNGYTEREGLIFIGGYEHQPNADAVLYFVQEILPLIVAQAPEIRFHVVGSNAPPKIQALVGTNVIVHGFVTNLDELMNRVRISVNPLRFGAGIKGKMITSMFYGVPCIGTSIAIEGMGVVPEQQALVADTPQEFASAVLRLYSNQELWERLSTAGRALVQQNFSLEAANRGFKRIFASFSGEQPCNDLYLERVISHDAWLQTDRQCEQKRRQEVEVTLAVGGEPYLSRGYCFVCGTEVSFHSDLQHGFPQPDGTVLPNWRERVVCPICELNNRMRASIHLFHLLCAPTLESSFYLTEQTTPLFMWFKQQYRHVIGSEYLGEKLLAGKSNSYGIRNESLTGLSFRDNEFDAILSFDVIEHIPDYLQAFKECLRCLKSGGSLFFTVPFAHQSQQHIIRAELDKNGAVRHLLPPEYHGDPINENGCLCFYHFGWELLDQLRSIGFRDVAAYFYWSQRFGYLGGDQLLFKATK